MHTRRALVPNILRRAGGDVGNWKKMSNTLVAKSLRGIVLRVRAEPADASTVAKIGERFNY